MTAGTRASAARHARRPSSEGEDPRAGRWRGREKTECGLHRAASVPLQLRVSEVPGAHDCRSAIDGQPGRQLVRPHRRPRGFIVWFTGLSGAGKSTLAEALRRQLSGGRPVEILDGDEVRTNLSKGSGSARRIADLNVRRIGFVARLLARNGVPTVTAAISPYAAVRQEVRRTRRGRRRAVRGGLCGSAARGARRARREGAVPAGLAGEIQHFTGVSDPYEPPVRPDVLVRSDREHVDESVARIVQALLDRELVTATVAEAVSR